MKVLHDPKRHRRRRPSETASPEFVVQEEPFLQIIDELPPLFLQYGEEHAKAPIAPDWKHLMTMAASGILKVMTARYNGQLVGFAFSIVGPTIMHAKTIHGITNAVWLTPAYRLGMYGYKLLKANRDMLIAKGCHRLFLSFQMSYERQGALYKRLGYKPEEVSYAYDNS